MLAFSSAHRIRLFAIALLSIAALLGVAALPPIPQPGAYHDFADQRTLLGVPHALNVVSNFVFLIVGVVGLRRVSNSGASFVEASERWPYLVFFASLVGVGIGSAHYHLAPSHGSLFWDRLPMSLAFMSLLSAVLVERLGPRVGLRLFPCLAAAGPFSVVYWISSERAAWRPGVTRRRRPERPFSAGLSTPNRPALPSKTDSNAVGRRVLPFSGCHGEGKRAFENPVLEG